METPRYTIGVGGEDEPGLILIGDNVNHTFVARSSEMARPFVEEMVRLANENAPVDNLKRVAQRVYDLFKDSKDVEHKSLAEHARICLGISSPSSQPQTAASGK